MICFPFFISTKSKTQMGHPLLSLEASRMKKPFSEVALQTRESLERPYFPLPLSILANTYLIMFLFFATTLVWFLRKSIPHLISEKIYAKPPRNTKKIAFFGSPCFLDLWICFRGLFAFMTLDLNFMNPKSAIFELGWRKLPLPANHDQITK